MTQPLVSIGLPVRNGASQLHNAISSLVQQSYLNIELIISDNFSDDDTQLIAQTYALRDKRISYYRQNKLLPVSRNFQFVLAKARGAFFMWAAHDDRRSLDFVESLLATLLSKPQSILAFGDFFSSSSPASDGELVPYSFENSTLSPLQRVHKACNPMCGHLYGLWKTDLLRLIPIYPCIWAWDQPLMPAAAYLGTFEYTSGPRLIYYTAPKSHADRALYQDGRKTFNKYSSLLELLYFVFLSSFRVGGLLPASVALISSLFLHIRNLPRFLFRGLSFTLRSFK